MTAVRTKTGLLLAMTHRLFVQRKQYDEDSRLPYQRATTYFFPNLERRESLCKRVYTRAPGEEQIDEECKACSVQPWSDWKA
jgi:hypothetical protein